MRFRRHQKPCCESNNPPARTMNRLACILFLFSALFLGRLHAQDIGMTGTVGFNRFGSFVTLSVERITNNRSFFLNSGDLELQLWATILPYTGGFLYGQKMASVSLGSLWGGNYFFNVTRTIPFFEPIAGSYYVTLVLAEKKYFTYETIDWRTFPMIETFGIPNTILLPPLVLDAPKDAVVLENSSVILSATVSSLLPLYYQWFKDGAPITGANSFSYTIASAAREDAGAYSIMATNDAGTILSKAASVVVNPLQNKPVLTSSELAVGTVGAAFNYLITATNNPRSYGADGLPAGLSLNADSGIISGTPLIAGTSAITLSASNGGGTAMASLVLTIRPVSLRIATDPQSQSVLSGSSTFLSVAWEGPIDTTIQWYRDGTPLTGGTSAIVNFPSVKTSDGGTYWVEIRSGAVAVTSGTARLTVKVPDVPVSILNQPEKEVSIAVGKPLRLSVVASGTTPLIYRWYHNGKEITGGTASSYNVGNSSETDSGIYTVKVSNQIGTLESEPINVSVLSPPSVAEPTETTISVKSGASATFTVVVTSRSGPFNYQWRKDGKAITGATSSSFTLQATEPEDSGVYDVMVSNLVGSVTSRPQNLQLTIPPIIVTEPPSSISSSIGAGVPLSVVAQGTEPLFYQWFSGDAAIEGGTASTYIAPAQVPGTTRYTVEVRSSLFPYPVRSKGTDLTVTADASLMVLRKPESETNVIRGIPANLKLNVVPEPPGVLRTTYKLLTHPSGKETGISGLVPPTGGVEVPLSSLATGGSYQVVFLREYAGGTVSSTVTTGGFSVVMRTLEEAAGTYELLLNDSNGLVGDGATYRGLLVATVSRSGSVSGRMLYNEAAPLPTAPGDKRAYGSVVRTFSAVFAPSSESPGKMVCSPRLGLGPQANRQTIQMELDFSGTSAKLSAIVRDRVSVPFEADPEGSVSTGTPTVRVVSKLTGVVAESRTVDFLGVSGRYVIGADFGPKPQGGPGEDNNAVLFVQVLPSGKLLWTCCLSGFKGSGFATLSTTTGGAPVAQLFLGRTFSTTGALSTTSLLGQIRFETETGNGQWRARVSTLNGDDKLERQSCYLTKESGTPIYDPERFAPSMLGTSRFNWACARSLDFQDGTSCRWGSSTPNHLPAFFSRDDSASIVPPLRLEVDDLGGGEPPYAWNLTMSPTGTIRAVAADPSRATPTLMFRLDKSKGEWSGAFLLKGKKTRCNLAGVVVRTTDSFDLRGVGWAEVGTLPATQTVGWRCIAAD
jgi:hypothetical protein